MSRRRPRFRPHRDARFFIIQTVALWLCLMLIVLTCSGFTQGEVVVRRALEHLGKPYDDLYMIDTQEIYCSELVQQSYVNGKGQRLFPLINMSFHDSNGNILDYWREHYAKHGMAVPEGALGTNPAQIASDPAVEILP